MTRVYDVTINGRTACLAVKESVYVSFMYDGEEPSSVVAEIFDADGKAIAAKREDRAVGGMRIRLPALKPLCPYTCRVTAKSASGDSSAETRFVSAGEEFGRAKWISDGRHFVADGGPMNSPAVYFRKTFYSDGETFPVVANVCGLGFFELKINGKRVSDVLDQPFTEYDKLVLYSSYEASSLIVKGENVIELAVGDGWYNQTTTDTWGFFRAPWRDCPKALFCMKTGSGEIVSDETWLVSHGEIVADAVRAGEYIDFNAVRNYAPASVTTPPGGAMRPAYLPPIRECDAADPVSVSRFGNKTVYDFGKNSVGYISATFEGAKGEEVRVTYSDRLADGSEPNNASNSMYIFDKGLPYQTDRCVLSGGADFYKPSFVYHGFRYAVVYGAVKISGVKAYFVHTDLKRTGSFRCGSDTLNKLYDMSVRSILSNWHSFPTDCPHREKNGWTGDAQLALEASVYTFDMREAYLKWLGDMAVNQRPSGQISAIIPSCGWGFNWGCGPAWDVAFFRVAEALVKYYNDDEALSFYPHLLKYFDYISGYKSVNGLLSVGLGDWNYPKKVEFDVCPTELTDSGYYAVMADILAGFSKAAGDGMSERFSSVAKATRKAIADKYSGEKSLTGLAALTYFGVADRTAEVVAYLRSHGYAPHAGILGVKFVLSVLGEGGYIDDGVKFLTRRDYPSFAFWIDNGQTTLCEDFELTNSLNHQMYSPVAEFMIRYLLGASLESGEAVVRPVKSLAGDASGSVTGFGKTVKAGL